MQWDCVKSCNLTIFVNHKITRLTLVTVNIVKLKQGCKAHLGKALLYNELFKGKEN